MKLRIRGFEPVTYKMMKDNKEFYLPRRGTSRSAGCDFSTPYAFCIAPKETKVIWTNVKAYMQAHEYLDIRIRSSLGIAGLILANQTGVVDMDYYSNVKNDGNIGICLYNRTNTAFNFKAGERIAQGIFKEYLLPDNDAPRKAVRDGGFGSTN